MWEKKKVTCGESYYDEPTCTGNSNCDILDKHNESITLHDIIRVKLNKAIWQGK